MGAFIDIVFEGAGPDLRFVEVEDELCRSIKVGEWVDRVDGYRALRIQRPDPDTRIVPLGNGLWVDPAAVVAVAKGPGPTVQSYVHLAGVERAIGCYLTVPEVLEVVNGG